MASRKDFSQDTVFKVWNDSFLRAIDKLRRSDETEATAFWHIDLEKYETKEITLNGYVRKLPKGQVASEQAVQLARRVGLELLEGETYVQPFIRHA